MKRLALLAAACAAYVAAAWMVAPGFYDGFGPQQPYAWTCPPPQAGANQKPASGHVTIAVINGVSDANSAYTADGQVVIGFLPGAFDATGKTSISVDITPTSTCPNPRGLKFVTDTYLVSADATLVKDSNITLVYSNLEPDPSAIYRASSLDGPWTSLGASPQAAPFTTWTKTRELGYFAAGYPAPSGSSGSSPTVGGGQALPVIVAVLIGVVILAGLPLAVIRRRRTAGGEEEEEDA